MQTQAPPANPANSTLHRFTADTTLNPADLLSPVQAASLLCLSAKTLATWRSTGRHALPYVKIASRIRYRRCDLDAWLESRMRTCTAETAKAVAA